MCGDCQVGKPTRAKYVHIGDITTTKVRELLHIYLFGPSHTEGVGGKKYALVCVVDY